MTKPSQWLGFVVKSGAQEKTRTSTVLPPLGPEPSASTNSATWAHCDERSPAFAAFTAGAVRRPLRLIRHRARARPWRRGAQAENRAAAVSPQLGMEPRASTNPAAGPG